MRKNEKKEKIIIKNYQKLVDSYENQNKYILQNLNRDNSKLHLKDIIHTEKIIQYCKLSLKNNKVTKVICLSTDKAAYPINAMGISKALMEKVAIAASRNLTNTTVCLTRYGNVMGSRGSVIPYFLSIKKGESLPITDKRMTRFMITLEEGVDLVWKAFDDMLGGEIFVKKILF